jgi:hypothetical protein
MIAGELVKRSLALSRSAWNFRHQTDLAGNLSGFARVAGAAISEDDFDANDRHR